MTRLARNKRHRLLSCAALYDSAAELEQSGRALSAADAHRHHAVANSAALHFVCDDAERPGPRHSARVAYGDRAAVDVELSRIRAEPIAAVDHLHGECLIQFPEADVGD